MPAAMQDPNVIGPDIYPQMLSRADAARAVTALRSPAVLARAQAAMETCKEPMRKAILRYAEELEAAGGERGRVYEKAHDIRGFAETVGMVTTGRIAESLCRYMDDMERAARPADATVLTLHVAAIVRAARAEEGDEAIGEKVATELAVLVARRLSEIERG